MAARPNPAVTLAEQLVETLRTNRDQGDAYPANLAALGADANPAVRDKALKNKAFTAHVVLAQKKHPDTPVVLAEDADRLVQSPALLEWLLEQVCTPDSPAVPLDKLTKKVEKPLQKPLQEHLERLVSAGSLPASVGSTTVKKKRICF